MAIDDAEQYDVLDGLVEEFAARLRRGEQPALKDYTDRYPELADELREAVPGAGPGRARERDLSGPGRGGAGSDHEPIPVTGGGLPDHPRDRPGGPGGGLRGRAGLARPPGGAEGPALAVGPGPPRR